MKIITSIIFLIMVSASLFASECGDVNADNKLNLLDVSYIISHLYRQGPAPVCGISFAGICGDVNADDKLNLLDVSYIISHLYRGGPEPICSGVKDIDGNIYQTIKIGTQEWMAENLKVTHYQNGDDIPNVANPVAWDGLTIGAYCEYDNDTNNVATYGRLYNWYAVTDNRIIAPAGWHVPSDAEWKQLEMYLGMSQTEADAENRFRGTDEGGKLKETGTTHWISPNTGATNESGFSGLPGGERGYSGENGYYFGMGITAWFWFSTESVTDFAGARALYYDGSGIYRGIEHKQCGFAVRCVKDKMPTVSTAAVSEITGTTAQCGGTVIFENDATVTERGVCWSTDPTPTVADNITVDGAGIGGFVSSITGLTGATTYYVRAYATNSFGTGYGKTLSFTTKGTVTDFDGNTYETVKIGDQWWMAENLKVTHYRNGDAIPNITGKAEWAGLTNGAYCDYNNDINNVAVYGKMYNWFAINDSRSLAPEGWHVPSDAEWKQLELHLGMSSSVVDNFFAWRGTIEGGLLKESGIIHWANPNTGATNGFGFTALPGGARNDDGTFENIILYAHIWTATEYNSLTAWGRSLGYNVSGIGRYYYNKQGGASIRCVKD